MSVIMLYDFEYFTHTHTHTDTHTHTHTLPGFCYQRTYTEMTSWHIDGLWLCNAIIMNDMEFHNLKGVY